MSNLKVKAPYEEESQSKKFRLGLRHIQLSLVFFSIVVLYAQRTSLSVAIIAMTEKTPPDPSIPTYPEWSNTDIILSSFFWGYIIPQIGAGQLGEYFGPKWFLFAAMVIDSISNLAIPAMAAFFGSSGVMICRIIQGLAQGFLYPSLSNLISQWAPIFERARVANFVYGAASLGIALSMPITGIICGSKSGWPLSYYAFGIIGLVWAVIFVLFAKNSPDSHKSISEEEKTLIGVKDKVSQTKKVSTPWLSILKSLPVWAIFVTGVGQCWGTFTLLTEIPSYMDGIMHFDISSNSKLSALPYVAQFVLGQVSSPIADKLIEKGTTSITASRKIFNSLASFLPAAALIYLAFLTNFEKNLVMTLLIVTIGTIAFQQSGFLINMIDIAPNHAGTLLGLINGFNNIFSFLAPLTVGLLGSDKTDPVLWQKVFLLAAGIYIISGIFYAVFTSAEVQAWNDPDVKNDEKQDKSSTYV